MLTADELYTIAKSRFGEAESLSNNGHPDGAVYLCGYALELILKRRIVLVLDWDGFPEVSREFKKLGLQSFQQHELSNLLRLGGLEKKISRDPVIEASWRKAKNWDSQNRYRRVGAVTPAEAVETIEATRRVLNWILKI